MDLPTEVFTGLGVAVLTIGLLAMMLKLVLLGLAIDDWYELRHSPSTSPEKMVADDELVSGLGRLLSVCLTVAVGILWVVIGLNYDAPAIRLTPLAVIIPASIAGQSVLACWQGARGLMFRRRLARVLSGRRRSSSDLYEAKAQVLTK